MDHGGISAVSGKVMTKAVPVGEAPRFELSDIERILGRQAAKLIALISNRAQKEKQALYLAGGVVRDLLLKRPTLDLDLVVAGDAIRFANTLARESGGKAITHKPFGTAKWILDESVAKRLCLPPDAPPPGIDFVTARSETYSHPTALPTVSPGDIKRDMLRRDFSVNALAIQISPSEKFGILLDFCWGGDDIRRGLIRALHDQSFVDDPTRILRALRYATRLGFDLETETAEWMDAALPYLGRITGSRLRNEIDLILREARASEIMLRLQAMGLLENIHPAFRVSPCLPELLAACQRFKPPWSTAVSDRQTLRWIALMRGISSREAQNLCERLALTKALTQAITASAKLAERTELLDDPAIRPSQLAQLLDDFPALALQACWLFSAEKPTVQARIAAYASDWRGRRPKLSGNDLKAMGVAPGPRYRQLLDRLRWAWIDGEIHSAEEEAALLRQLLEAEDLDRLSNQRI